MSEYIKKDAIDKAFSKLRFNNDGELEHYGDRPNWYLWGSEVENLIADTPSIDIVHCRECKYAEIADKTDDQDGYTCQFHRGSIWFSGSFCSWGKRKESE